MRWQGAAPSGAVLPRTWPAE